MTKDEIRDLVRRVRAGLRITKVVATRSVRGRSGETQAGFTAEFPEGQEMTLSEAIAANCILSREADLAAYRNAIAGGNVSLEQGHEAMAAIRTGYAKLLAEALQEAEVQDR